MLLPDVGNIFHEQHDQDVAFIFRRIDDTAKSVAGLPEDAVDFVLVDLGGHALPS